MQCPLEDGILSHHTKQGENGLTVSYSTCPTCHGYWMDSFSANFIKISKHEETSAIPPMTSTYVCPVCTTALLRSTGDNIPEGIFIFECPQHHGYFFPTGQLAAFKKAQKIKIEYHKLWHIPMPSVGSILLGSFILLLVSGGLVVTLRGLQHPQPTQSEAKQILTNHAVYIANNTTALFTATTSVNATVTLHIPSLTPVSQRMRTNDNRTHLLTIEQIPPGTYDYFFTIDIAGHVTQSDRFTFTILDQ